jgi:metallo-beta-lactamase class B
LAEPARVFDNLYFVGTRSLNAWAVVTPEGIVIIDPLYDENVELAIVDGLRKLGLDPENITHVIVSHGHGDHFGGARLLQERYGAKVILSPADWDVVAAAGGSEPKPFRDLEVSDGEVITIGGVPFTFTLTPGHTPGTLSTTFPVRDGDATHLVAIWGGTALPNDRDGIRDYIASSIKFESVVRDAGADVLLSNHDIFDDVHRKILDAGTSGSSGENPFVIGTEATNRYLDVVRNCASATLARIPPNAP